MSLNKLWQIGLSKALGRKGYKTLSQKLVYTAFARGLNFAWFAFTVFWFLGSWSQIDRIFSAISPFDWALVALAVWASASLVLALWESLRARLLLIRTSEAVYYTHLDVYKRQGLC